MADAIPAGAAFIDVKPTFRTWNKDVTRGAVAGGKAGGAAAGKALGVEAAKTAEPSLRKLGAAVGAARSKEADAAGKVRVAEARLNETRADGKAKASVLTRAEEGLAKAQRELRTSQDRTTEATKDYTRAQQRAGREVEQTDRKARGLARRLGGVGSAFKSAGSKASGFAKSTGGQVAGGMLAFASIDSAFQFGKDAIGAASEREQSAGGVKAIFGKDAKVIETASKSAAKNLGLTRNSYNELASTLGAGLKNKGIKDYADQTKTLIGYGADLSSQFGGTTKEAVDSLASAMRGEMDPIEKYGVTLNQDAIAAEAFSLGLAKPVKNLELIKAAQNKAIVAQRNYNEAVKKHGKNSDEALSAEASLLGAQNRLGKALDGNKPKLTDQQKAQAALSLITKQTATAHGNYTRELDTAAGAGSQLSASWGDLKTDLGEQLLPLVTSGTIKLADFVVGMNDGTGAGGEFAGTVKSIAGDLQAAWKVISPYKKEILAVGVAFGTWKVASGVVGGIASEVRTARNAVTSVRDSFGTLKTGLSDFRSGLKNADIDGEAGKARRVGDAFRQTSTRAKDAGRSALASGKSALTAAKSYGALALAHTKAGLTAGAAAIKTGALKVAQLASAAATKTLTVVTRVFNAVMRMNPIGLVVTALLALGAGLVLAYKKSATFRRIVDGAFAGVKAAGVKVFGWIRNTGLPWMRDALGKIGGVAKWLWSKIYRPYFGLIFGIGKKVFGWIKNTGLPWAMAAFRGIGAGAKWLWNRGISPWFGKVRSGATRLVSAFRSAKDGIGKIWSGLKETIAKPVRTALGWVNDYFIKPINSMLGKVGASFKVPLINLGGGKVSGKGRYDAGDFYTGGRTGGRARGGILPGFTPMHRGDDQLTPMRSGEGVLVSEGLRDARSRSVFLAANEAAKRGVSFAKFMGAGFAEGGIVALGKRLQGMGYHVSEHPAFGGVVPGAHSANGWHYKAGALDVNADPWLTKFRSEMPALDTLNAMLRREGWNTIWRAANHFDHLHVDIGNGQTGGMPSGGGFLSGLARKVFEKGRGVLNALLDKAPKGLWSSALVGVGKKLTQTVYDKFMGAAQAMGAGDVGGLSGFTSTAGGSNVDLGRRMAAAVGWTGNEWLALKELWTNESNWNHRARNPSSGAYGIPQALPASKMASAGSDWQTNPATQIKWGIKYIKDDRPDYGTPSKALALWRSRSPHWYARGVRSAPSGPAVVGEEGPELMWFRGGERVTSNRESRRLVAGPSGPMRISGEVLLRMGDGRAYIEGVVDDVLDDQAKGSDALDRTR